MAGTGLIYVIVHTEPLHRPKAYKDNCHSSSEMRCVTQTDADIVHIDERHELTTSCSNTTMSEKGSDRVFIQYYRVG